jgi:predicted methyltransferase
MRRALAALLLATAALSTACDTASGPAESHALSEGINDRFLAEDLDVDAWVERFEGESREIYAQREAIVDALGLEPGSRVADVGAGTGFFSALFAREVGPDGIVYAVEISPKFLEHLRQRKAELGLSVLRVVEGTRDSVELPPASIDVAFVCDVYHHFESPEASLASLHRALRPGGALFVIDFERIPGESPDWVLEHVRAGRDVFTAEIESAGFDLAESVEIDGLDRNYVLHFVRSDGASPGTP